MLTNFPNKIPYPESLNRIEYSYNLDKKDLDTIVGSSKEFPFGHVLIKENSEIHQRIKKIKALDDYERISFAFIANSNKDYPKTPSYLIHYIENAKIEIKKEQDKEIIFGHERILEFIEKNFEKNELYSQYNIRIILPPTKLSQYLQNKHLDHQYSKPYQLNGKGEIVRTLIRT